MCKKTTYTHQQGLCYFLLKLQWRWPCGCQRLKKTEHCLLQARQAVIPQRDSGLLIQWQAITEKTVLLADSSVHSFFIWLQQCLKPLYNVYTSHYEFSAINMHYMSREFSTTLGKQSSTYQWSLHSELLWHRSLAVAAKHKWEEKSRDKWRGGRKPLM